MQRRYLPSFSHFAENHRHAKSRLCQKISVPPLGIIDAYWKTNSQGIDYGYDELLLTPGDMAKIGWLYLNKGA